MQDGEMQGRSAGVTDMIAVFRELHAGHSPDRGGARGSQHDAPVPQHERDLSDESDGAEQT